MRVLIVTRSLPFHRLGGMEVVAWEIACALVQKGHRVRVLTTRCESHETQLVREGVTIECLPVPPGRYSGEWWRLSRIAFTERLAVESDIVLSVSAAGRAMARGRKRGQMPHFVVQAHGTAWGEAISKLRGVNPLNWLRAITNLKAMFDDRAYRSFDCFVAVGEKVRNDLASYPTKSILGPVPIEVIPNGINAQAFAFNESMRLKIREKLGLLPNDRAVISTSRLNIQKGLTESLAAFELAAAKNASLRYVIVGSGPMERSLKSMVRSRGLEQLVKFTGSVPRDQMPAYLSASDIFLFTTFRVEGLPLNVLEALAAGLPCIVSNHIDDPSWAAIGVQPSDTVAVAREILKLSQVKLGDRGSRLPRQHSLDVATDRYIELFERLIGSKAR